MDINENIEYLKAKADILENELLDLKKKISDMEDAAKTPEPPNKRWRAKKDEQYWYLWVKGGARCCSKAYENYDYIDNYFYSVGNYFKTKEEAEFEYERLKVINELKAWSTNKAGIQFIIGFVIHDAYPHKPKHELKIMSSIDYLTLRFTREPVYFENKEDVDNAVKAVGEERILKYYFIKDLSNNKEEEN